MAAKFPAAFINAIAEEGTKAEAVQYLQGAWDELQTLKRACIADGYDPHYLANGVLTKRHAWRDTRKTT